MSPDNIREVVGRYRTYFEEMGIEKIDHPHDNFLRTNSSALLHCHGMLEKILAFLDEGRIEKAHRWLGFVQACLWMSRECTLAELKSHNRPD